MSSWKTVFAGAVVVVSMAAVVTAQESDNRAAAPAAPPATPATPEKIAAVVNGEPISEAELAAVVERQLRGRQVPPETLQEVRQLILQSLINGRLVNQFVAAKKIEADPKQVDSAMEDVKKRVAAAGLPLDAVLQVQGLTEQSLRSRIAAELAFQAFADAEVTDETLKDYFASHKQEYDGTEVRASHLLIKLEEDAGDQQRKAALAKVQAIRQEIVEGLDFAEAATKYSGCPSASDGGDLGFFPRRDQMVEPFARAAFALAKGEVSEPVKTRFGFHLIRVTDRKPGDKGLEDVRDELKAALDRDLWRKTAAEQREGAEIEIPD